MGMSVTGLGLSVIGLGMSEAGLGVSETRFSNDNKCEEVKHD